MFRPRFHPLGDDKLKLSKVRIDHDFDTRSFKRLRNLKGIDKLAHLDYKASAQPSKDPYFAKILKRLRNLKNLTLDFKFATHRSGYMTLYTIIGQLRLKSLTIIHGPNDLESPSNTLNSLKELVRLLQKLRTLETLRLKFTYFTFDNYFSEISHRLFCHKLTKLKLKFDFTSPGVDKWMVSFSQAISKALTQNTVDPKTMYLSISKFSCPELTLLDITNFLSSFDQPHLTNYVALKLKTKYACFSENLGVNFVHLFKLFVRRQQKFQLKVLHISDLALSQSSKEFSNINQTLPLTILRLGINGHWCVAFLKTSMKFIKQFFQPKKTLKILFPSTVRHEIEGRDCELLGYNYDSEEYTLEHNIIDVVLPTVFSMPLVKDITIDLDFSVCDFCVDDYISLQYALEDIQRPITCLVLRLPPPGTFGDIISLTLNLICCLNNVEVCEMDISHMELKGYEDYGGFQQAIEINECSSLKKLILKVAYSGIKPEVLWRILKIVKELPRLESIDVICCAVIYEGCRPIQALKLENNVNKILCNFVLDN